MLKQSPKQADTDANAVMKARLEYAERGWWTFPAPPIGEKKSLKSAEFSNGVNWGATTDPEVIQKEFRQRRFRNQNVGIATGVESCIFVIETDTAAGHGDGVDGAAALQAWEKEHGALPPTL